MNFGISKRSFFSTLHYVNSELVTFYWLKISRLGDHIILSQFCVQPLNYVYFSLNLTVSYISKQYLSSKSLGFSVQFNNFKQKERLYNTTQKNRNWYYLGFVYLIASFFFLD